MCRRAVATVAWLAIGLLAGCGPRTPPPDANAVPEPAAKVDAAAPSGSEPVAAADLPPSVTDAEPVAEEPSGPESSPESGPEEWDELELTPLPKPGCARIDEPTAGRSLCHVVHDHGAEIDEMTEEERGTFTVLEGKTVIRTVEYDRVRSEGAAGSLYETYMLGDVPVLLVHRCMGNRRPTKGDDGYDPCGVRFPPDFASSGGGGTW